MILQPEQLDDRQRSTMDKLCRLFPQIGEAEWLAQEFTRIVRERSADKYNEWLRSAMQGKLIEFLSFALGLSEGVIKSAGEPRMKWLSDSLNLLGNRSGGYG